MDARRATVDAGCSGNGKLEIIVNKGTIPCKVENKGNRHFTASFQPTQPGLHIVEVKFNGKDVPGEFTIIIIIIIIIISLTCYALV